MQILAPLYYKTIYFFQKFNFPFRIRCLNVPVEIWARQRRGKKDKKDKKERRNWGVHL